MEYRKFGPTDITVSALGFGCYDAAGGGYGDKMAAAVQQAVDLGITCFDTAAGYGNGESERMLGKALGPAAQRGGGGDQMRCQLRGPAKRPG